MLGDLSGAVGLIELDNGALDLNSIDPAKLAAVGEAYLRISSEQDADETLRLTSAAVKGLMGSATVAVSIAEGQKGRTLRLMHVLGESSQRLTGRRMLSGDAGCLGRAYSTRKPCLYRMDRAHEGAADPVSEMIGTERALAVPMMSRGRCIGAMAAYGGPGERYTDEDLFMLSQLAGYAAVSIDNSMLIYELKREKLKSGVVLDRVDDGLLFIGDDGVVAAANKSFLEIFGLTREDLVDRHIRELDDIGGLKEALLWPGTTSNAPRCHEYVDCNNPECAGRDAESFRCWTLQPSGCENGSGEKHDEKLWGSCASCDYLADIAGRISAPREVAVNGRRLRVSSALVVENGDNRVFGELVAVQDLAGESLLRHQRSELISMLSHDLRAPLSLIAGYSEIIATHDDVESMRDMGRTIRKSSNVLLGMINNILEHSALASGAYVLKKTRIKAGALIGYAVDSYGGHARDKGVRLVTKVAEDTPELDVDLDQALRLMGNLIVNAVDYGPEGGRVVIGAKPGPQGYVELTVEDEGSGIPEEEMGRIFESYYRARNGGRVQGTGLGLSIVEAVAEAHGGRAYVSNRPEGGARFGVILPAAGE